MKLVQTLIVRDEAEFLDAHLAFHLNAGVDFVVATHHGSPGAASQILESYERAGYVRLFREQGGPRLAEWRTNMARLAATEYEAEWVINSGPEDFWWPRGESLEDVLAPIPLRYTVIQGLVREFVDGSGGDELFSERMTRRRSLQNHSHSGHASPAAILRPVHRADPNVVVHADGTVGVNPFVPLRAWYPIEVFRFPVGDGKSDGSLVTDTRLRDALRVLRERAPSEGKPGSFALPGPDAPVLSFRTPDVVDDAAYAVECAAVGEVDLPRLETYIAELEHRIAWLEQRFWPRVLRLASRLLRRPA